MPIASNVEYPLLHSTVAPYRFGRSDPTTIFEDNSLWRATVTPDGSATVHIENLDRSPIPHFYGPGALWLERRYETFLGAHDCVPDLAPQHHAIGLAQKRFGHLRLGRSETPYHEIIPAILGQRVTAGEAVRQWKTIVQHHGERAPGPHRDLMLPPTPEKLVKISYTTFHTYGIDRKRAEAIHHVARLSHFLIRDWPHHIPAGEHTQALLHLPGVGGWTAAITGSVAFGDPDALAVGDFHLKNTIAWALHRKARGTDDEMIASLAPYTGHRHRIVRWLQLMGYKAPARGPRRPIQSITQL